MAAAVLDVESREIALNSMPPEPDLPVQGFPVQEDKAPAPEQLTWQPGQQDMPSRPAPRRLSLARVVCGVVWGVIAAITAVGGGAELAIGNVGGAVVCFVIAAGSGWYDYRVWTFKARRLLLFIM
jgi:hypothetical protein